MLDATLRMMNYRMQSPCMGDLRVRDMLEYYSEKRKTILNYKGKSAVDKEKVKLYESILLEDKYDTWFHRYSKAYLDRVLWLIRRLKVGITPMEEYELVVSYYNRMPISEVMFSRYDKKSLYRNPVLWKYFQEHGIIK